MQFLALDELHFGSVVASLFEHCSFQFEVFTFLGMGFEGGYSFFEQCIEVEFVCFTQVFQDLEFFQGV